MTLTIESIQGRPHLVPLLAGWHHGEWGGLYRDDRWNLAIATDELEQVADGRSDDTVWVAFDGDGRDVDDVVGSVALLATDDLDGFDHLTPWLASLFVRPDARGLGIAAELIERAVDEARHHGHDVVYLFTSGQEAYYLARGWITTDTTRQRGHVATVMRRATG